MKQKYFMYFNDNATVNASSISVMLDSDNLAAIDTTAANVVTMYFTPDLAGDQDGPDDVAITCTNGATDQLDYTHRKSAMNSMVQLANSVNRNGYVTAFDTLNSINPNSTDIVSIAVTLNS